MFVIVSQQTRNNKFCTDCSGVSGTAFFICPTNLTNPSDFKRPLKGSVDVRSQMMSESQ
ncbi:hypothetical protein Xvie_00375 [Xenorhabdus vietnamensis]|uniref:Uncharacterized protein n=1 Tax=Xenorhabdus vietnamensis TaxID=351656 RepID=A0A1Y2SIV4_9GAMM|nr:hypothetical protein Xvie_00375 [Xenorhabdus vietnamensis]